MIKTIEIVPYEELIKFENLHFAIYLDEKNRTFRGASAFLSFDAAANARALTKPNSAVRIVKIKPGMFERVADWPE